MEVNIDLNVDVGVNGVGDFQGGLNFNSNIPFEFKEDWDDVKYIKDTLLNGELDPWDKMILVYLAFLGYQNFQLANKTYQCIMKTSAETPFQQQFLIYFLLFYSLNNVHIAYRYFLLKTYTVNKDVAQRIYRKFNKYFDYFTPTSEYKPRGRYQSEDEDDVDDVDVENDDLANRLVREQMQHYYGANDANGDN